MRKIGFSLQYHFKRLRVISSWSVLGFVVVQQGEGEGDDQAKEEDKGDEGLQ